MVTIGTVLLTNYTTWTVCAIKPKILDKFKRTQKGVTLQDLHYKVNHVRQELKIKNKHLEKEITILKFEQNFFKKTKSRDI